MSDPSRRVFLNNLASAAIGAVALGRRASAQNLPAHVNAETLRQRLEGLSVFGRPPGGTFADGVSRVAYSDADVAGRRYTIDLMRAAGLDPRVDPAGNIFGRRAGTDASLPPILFGSHIDSVPNGGNFDGDLGSFAALGVLEALAAAKLRTRHSLEMVVWSAEEGVAFSRGLNGSRIVAGDVKTSDMDQVWNGMTRAEALRKIGGDPGRIMEAVRTRGAHHCYLELHIEQGGTLERQGHSRWCGRGHRRDRSPRSDGDWLCESRRDNAYGGSAGCAVGGFAADNRGQPNRQPGTGPPRRDCRQDGCDAQLTERDSRCCAADDRIARSVTRETYASREQDSRARSRNSQRYEDLDSVHIEQSQRAGECGIRSSAGDRTERWTTRASQPANAERRRARRTDDGAALADGHDLRAERPRHQPLASRTDTLGRLRSRGRYLAQHRIGDGSRVGHRVALGSRIKSHCETSRCGLRTLHPRTERLSGAVTNRHNCRGCARLSWRCHQGSAGASHRLATVSCEPPRPASKGSMASLPSCPASMKSTSKLRVFSGCLEQRPCRQARRRGRTWSCESETSPIR